MRRETESQKRQIKTRITASLTLLALSSLLVACGGQSYRRLASQPMYNDNYDDNNDGGDNNPSPKPSPSPTPTPTKGVAPLKFRVGTVGYNSVTITVSTHSTLKVKFTPGTQDQTVSGSDLSPQYSGLGVYISAGDGTQATPFLYNGLYGGKAESATIDFSDNITTGCPSTDKNCRANVTITVKQPNYNYWCLTNGYGCPWSHVDAKHPWHGTLTVQTDDTDGV
jgi:hypothetical protein